MASGSDLLRMLEPAVRPTGSPAPAVRNNRPIERRAFGDLLAEMRNRPVSFSESAERALAERGIRLDVAQQSALNDAADRAQAAGGQRTLMLMDGVGMIVDLAERTVEDVVDEAGMREGAVTRIDSALRVGGGSPAGAQNGSDETAHASRP